MNMNDLLKKLDSLDIKKKSVIKESINERGMSQNVDEWEDDDEERHHAMVDAYYDTVVNALDKYEVDGPLSDKEHEDLCREIANDLDNEVDHDTIHAIISNELEHRERDRAEDGPIDSSDDAEALASAGHGSDEDYGTMYEASIADIPADVLQRGIDQIEAGEEITKVFGQLNLETKRQYIDQFKSLIRGAQNDAHMEYDTQGGDITPFLLDTMKGLAARSESGAHGEKTISPIHGENMRNESHSDVMINGKAVDLNSLEFGDVHQWDAPDYADAYVAAATFVDGTPLSEIEIDELQNKYAAEVHTAIHNSLHENNLTLESLRYLSGVNKTVNECGIPTVMGANTPAAINITAASGSELTGMLKDIMNLAGVHKVEPQHMPIDVIASPASPIEAPSDMASLIKVVSEPEADLDSMNDHEEETEEGMLGQMAGGAIGALAGGPMGAALGGAIGDKLGGKEEETDESSGEKEENRPYDSSPHEKIRQDGVRKFGDNNSGSGKGRIGTQPNAQTTESIAEQLYADYRAFVAEAAADEPAEPDADAIAKRKRLQAIKDRQEDERAEKAYKTDSNVRVHHAKYDNDVDEGYDTRNAYEKCDPKHPDFKKNYEKYKAANPTGTLADFVAKMKRK